MMLRYIFALLTFPAFSAVFNTYVPEAKTCMKVDVVDSSFVHRYCMNSVTGSDFTVLSIEKFSKENLEKVSVEYYLVVSQWETTLANSDQIQIKSRLELLTTKDLIPGLYVQFPSITLTPTRNKLVDGKRVDTRKEVIFYGKRSKPASYEGLCLRSGENIPDGFDVCSFKPLDYLVK